MADEKVYDCFCRAFLSQTSPQDIDDSDEPDASSARESESDSDNDEDTPLSKLSKVWK